LHNQHPGFHRIYIRKEALKFSAAHMTVFPDGTKEALHGHNYRTELAIDLAEISLQSMISFSKFKDAVREISKSWDERVLVAEKCPFLKMGPARGQELEFTLCGKRYVLPADEVVLLPVDNITTETLSQEFCRQFVERLDRSVLGKAVLGIEVRIDEIAGQGASYFWSPRA
jgi:6-pyruvoyltetrahydropterin/6-carboxytetrahydropterin synthase